MDTTQQLPAISITFSPAWWHERYGLTFHEDIWSDPIARTELDVTMRRLMYDCFGDVGLGERDPEPHPTIEAYGHRFMAACWGCEIRYLPDQWPAAIVLPEAAERMAGGLMPALDTSPILRRALSEARLLENRYGSCDGNINLGGPLNNAVSVLGDAMLQAISAEPEEARRVLFCMAEVVIAVYERLTCSINRLPATWPKAGGGLGNCPVCMISPKSYRDVVLPADQWYRNHFEGFGIHHCGAMHPYVEVYRELRPGSLDVGWTSDRRCVRECYPALPLSLMLEASALRGKSQSEIDDIIAGMIDEAGPPDLITQIWVAEAGTEISDAAVRDLMTATSRIPGGS